VKNDIVQQEIAKNTKRVKTTVYKLNDIKRISVLNLYKVEDASSNLVSRPIKTKT